MSEHDLVFNTDDDNWQMYGNCIDVDPDLFIPERRMSDKQAKEVCASCIVREQCLDYAIVNNEDKGIWGGKSAKERRKLRRQRDRNIGHRVLQKFLH